MRPIWAPLTMVLLTVAAVSLGACREDEQGRVLLFKKGVYLGKADTDISAKARRNLNERIRRQSSGGGSGGGGGARPADVRLPPGATPSAASAASKALRKRLERQN
ncbi:MAG: hypothetical protein V3U44_02840 [Alphaproteobacteria bacterium]